MSKVNESLAVIYNLLKEEQDTRDNRLGLLRQ